jgi:uncharacterized protein (DUF2384 family)
MVIQKGFDDDKQKAARWLGTPRKLFDDACPFELLSTEERTKRVEEVLHRIEHGI